MKIPFYIAENEGKSKGSQDSCTCSTHRAGDLTALRPSFCRTSGYETNNELRKLHYFWWTSKDVETYMQRCTSCGTMTADKIPTAPLGELPEN
jgi:hypothetical protein